MDLVFIFINKIGATCEFFWLFASLPISSFLEVICNNSSGLHREDNSNTLLKMSTKFTGWLLAKELENGGKRTAFY